MALSDTLVKINTLRKELDDMKPLSREVQDILWQKFRLEWDYNSNHIEGNTLTYGETFLLLMHGETTGDHKYREYEEMKAHDLAVHIIREWAEEKERDISEADIRELNKIILKEPYWKEAITYDGQPTRKLIKIGDYKTEPNSVRLITGEIFHYASPVETPRAMYELLEWYRSANTLHPLLLAAELHYRYIRIHPFDDGNGRIARLLVNYVLIKHNYPPIVIKSNDKASYLSALRKADAGDKTAFADYLANQLVWSLELTIKAAMGESIEETDDIEKEIAIWVKNIAKDDINPVHKGDIVISNLYELSFSKLFALFEKKHKQSFGELFHKIGISYTVNNKTGETKDWMDKMLIESLVFKTSESIPDTLWNLQINVIMQEHKLNLKNPFWINSLLNIKLAPYLYTVNHGSDVLIEKKYSQSLNDEEQRQIVSQCIKEVFERIKKAAKPG